jgi:WD40 repeat protein
MEMAAAGAAAGAIGSLVATSGVVVCGLAEELLGPSTRVGKVAGFGDPTLANTSRMAGFILDAEHAPFCHTRQVTVVRVLAERGLVITGAEDAAIHIWLFAAGAFTLAKRLEGHVRAIRSLLIATVAGATHLYSAGDDGMIKQWDMSAGREGSHIRTVNVRTESNAHSLSVTCLAQYADAASGSVFVISAGADRKLCVWNAADLAFVAGSDAYDAVTSLATVHSEAGDALIVLGCQSGTLAVKKFGATGIEDVGCVFTGGRGHAPGGPIVAVMSGGNANFVSVSESGQMVFWTA